MIPTVPGATAAVMTIAKCMLLITPVSTAAVVVGFSSPCPGSRHRHSSRRRPLEVLCASRVQTLLLDSVWAVGTGIVLAAERLKSSARLVCRAYLMQIVRVPPANIPLGYSNSSTWNYRRSHKSGIMYLPKKSYVGTYEDHGVGLGHLSDVPGTTLSGNIKSVSALICRPSNPYIYVQVV